MWTIMPQRTFNKRVIVCLYTQVAKKKSCVDLKYALPHRMIASNSIVSEEMNANRKISKEFRFYS